MGTRADFYVGRGESAEWLGSIAWDGYPDGIAVDVIQAKSEDAYRKAVSEMLDEDKASTRPERGWPWPWEDSRTTDYAYAFDGEKVWASCFGSEWWSAADPEPDHDSLKKTAIFPNMKNRQRVTFGARSGLIVFPAPPEE